MTGFQLQDSLEMYVALHSWFKGLIPDENMHYALTHWYRVVEA
jgi:hypothetical protein